MTGQRPITLLLCALGGEGGGVLSEWLMAVARRAGYAAQATSIPGVAQRTGATTYYVEVFPLPLAQLGGRKPVFSLSPVPGGIDVLVSSELLETVRQIGNGMADAQRTRVITSSSRALTTVERVRLGDGRMDSARLVEVVGGHSRECDVLDMAALSAAAGTAVSAVMLGALAGSGVLPFAREHYEAVVGAGGRGAEASLRGFAQACDAVAAARPPVLRLRTEGRAPASLPADVAARFPSALHEVLALGHARLLDYQDRAYAAVYVERLARVLDAERAADPAAVNGFATTAETARWLALWMAFDDIVRVADLKIHDGRWQRVREEVKAGDGDVVKVFDHFRPGIPEIAGLLPAGLASRLMQRDARRRQRGLEPWSIKLVLGVHTVGGALALRLLSSLRWLRRRGRRYAEEQALIEQWLDGVVNLSRQDWQLGHEVALCGRLIKGYGSTSERGKDNLLHVLGHLAHEAAFASRAERAAAIASAREAALDDESGRALDAELARHGAAPRPARAVPMRFMRKPSARGTGASTHAADGSP